MAKDPAFLFYPTDFMGGTQFLSDEQVGKYVRLLVAQHQTGHLKKEHMMQICKTYDKDVFSKFLEDENGLFFNQRLESEVNKRKEYSKSRADNRRKKETYVEHMGNRNENRNTNTVLDIKKAIKFDENFEYAIFSDGHQQPLGSEQKILAQSGGIKPSTIIRGSIY